MLTFIKTWLWCLLFPFSKWFSVLTALIWMATFSILSLFSLKNDSFCLYLPFCVEHAWWGSLVFSKPFFADVPRYSHLYNPPCGSIEFSLDVLILYLIVLFTSLYLESASYLVFPFFLRVLFFVTEIVGDAICFRCLCTPWPVDISTSLMFAAYL